MSSAGAVADGAGRGGVVAGLGCAAPAALERHRQRKDKARHHGTSSRGISRAAMSAIAAAGPRGSSHSAPPIATKSAPALPSGPTSSGVAAKATQGISNTSAHHSIRSRIASNDGRCAGGVGLAEHHVVGAAFGCQHRVVSRVQAAAAGDARGLESLAFGGERVDAGQVRAIGAAARRDLGVAVEQQGRAVRLHEAASVLTRLISVRSPSGLS